MKKILNKKTALAASVICAAALIFTGCGSESGERTAGDTAKAESGAVELADRTAKTGNTIALSEGEINVTVTSVEGEKLTVTLGGFGGERGGKTGGFGGMQGMGGGGGFSDLTGGQGSGEAPEGMTPPEIGSGEAPEGIAPPDMGSGQDDTQSGGRGGFKTGALRSGAGAVITVTDESAVFNADGSEASLSDITEGASLTVTVGADGSVEKIVINSPDGAAFPNAPQA